ncbi:MAG TPA: VanZ family protein [Burkholderiales bacterium]|nr:VanZ family protein [Burkholderiales bacterium]
MQNAIAQEASTAARPDDTGARLGLALLGYMLAVTLIVALLPFHFEWPDRWNVEAGDDPYAAVFGALLFVPLGFLYRLGSARERGSLALVVLNAALISVAIEAIQLFDVTHDSTVLDVAANTAGALIGVLCFDAIARSAKHHGWVIGWLGLEIPLMGLVYLLVPLLWVNTLAARGDLPPTLMTLLIGAFGATLLGGLQRHYFGPRGAAEAHHTAGFAGLWFFAGAFAMLPWQPFVLIAGVVGATVLCWWLGQRPLPEHGANRRFEGALLRAATPLYGVYLLMLIVLPVLEEIGAWHGHVGFPRITSSQVETARLLELCAAFTLLGYMAAEMRGRQVMHYRDALPRLIGWSVALAVAAEATRGFGVEGASLVRGLLTVAACLYGGWLYYLQRAHVIQLVSAQRR